MSSVHIEREFSSILVPGVNFSEPNFEELFEIHCLKKQLLAELIKGECDFEEILEGLEALISTKNMDNFLVNVENPLTQLFQKHGLSD